MEENQLSGIPDGRGLDFINSLLLVVLSNESIVKCLEEVLQFLDSPTNLVHYLAIIYKMLICGSTPKTIIVADLTRIYFPNYQQFELAIVEEVHPW